MAPTLVLFTRDLRIHDHPALAGAASRSDGVVPLFVLDERILAGAFAAPNRLAFLLDALRDLGSSLAELGSPLVIRRGDVAVETARLARACGADAVFMTADVSRYAAERGRRVAAACAEAGAELRCFPGVTVVPPGELRPDGEDHYRVFTPYWRRWRSAELRPVRPAPRRLSPPARTVLGSLPAADELIGGAVSPGLPPGGETEGRRRLNRWARSSLEAYGERHDLLAEDGTSRLSAYLHFGCLSPREVLHRLDGRPGAEPFLRQLCWRDFYHQLLAANPSLPRDDYRPRGDDWNDDEDALAAWRAGQTGLPIVDAGMRQLAAEGWMHNRARLLTASFLTKDLYVDWRHGAQHFFDLLVDGDLANNAGNWQWVAGTGTDTRPNRVFNPLAQAKRFDPHGDYVRRYVPELASVESPLVHEPWRLDGRRRATLDYPVPIVELRGAAERFRQLRLA